MENVRHEHASVATMVLVIDDEESIAEMAREILESEHYRVMTELNPISAIKLYKQHQSEIGIVLLDLTMPEMSGKEVMEALLAINPNVKIIISSGYTEYDTNTKVDMTKACGFLHKPYTFTSLLSIMKAIAG
ncbi:MAG TPA: response regulator [Bacteroidota bacterium]|nr:response regulator [Bacteroidota bacterium]